MEFDLISIPIYCGITAAAVAVEHALFKGMPEIARRAMGITTVLIVTAVYFALGYGDLQSLVIVTLGFLSSALALGFALADERRKSLEIKRRMLKRNEAQADRQ
jgi:hypothetical protein